MKNCEIGCGWWEREIFISSLIHTCMFAVVFVVIVSYLRCRFLRCRCLCCCFLCCRSFLSLSSLSLKSSLSMSMSTMSMSGTGCVAQGGRKRWHWRMGEVATVSQQPFQPIVQITHFFISARLLLCARICNQINILSSPLVPWVPRYWWKYLIFEKAKPNLLKNIY